MRETGNREQSSDYYVLRGEWHARRGESEAARLDLDRAVEQADREQGPGGPRCAPASRRRPALRDPAAAAATLAVIVREADALGDALLRIRAAEALARAELGRGRPREAEESARRALKVAESLRMGSRPVSPARAARPDPGEEGRGGGGGGRVPRERAPHREAPGRARPGSPSLLRRAPRGAGGRSLDLRPSRGPRAGRARRTGSEAGASDGRLIARDPGTGRGLPARDRAGGGPDHLRERASRSSASARARSGSGSSPRGSCVSRRPSGAGSPASSMTASASP